MSTQRTRVLLEMLMKEPGVSAVVLPGPDGRIGIRIDLNVGENDKKEIEALFGKDSKQIVTDPSSLDFGMAETIHRAPGTAWDQEET